MERVPAAVERRHFLASKLSAPPRRPGFVDRPVLTNSLQSASYAGVVLVSAPHRLRQDHSACALAPARRAPVWVGLARCG